MLIQFTLGTGRWLCYGILYCVFLLSFIQAESGYWDNKKIYGRASPSLPYGVERAYPNLNFKQKLVDLEVVPLSDRLLLLGIYTEGIVVFNDENDVSMESVVPLLSIKDEVKLYSMVLHPDFEKNSYLYVCLFSKKWADIGAGNKIFRYELKVSGDKVVLCEEERKLVLEWQTDGHDGCDMRFGHDKMLYISTGDGQKPADPGNSGQHTDNLRGSILRIDVSSIPYCIPEDNPFVKDASVRPEVWAYGYRNPWRMHFDQYNNLWVADNGEDLWEMVHSVKKGDNAGWSAYEGGRAYRLENLGGPVKKVAFPKITHSHTEAQSIIGGLEYKGEKFPSLRDSIIYGDFVTGKVWCFKTDEDSSIVDHKRIADSDSFIAIEQDSHKELIFLGTEGKLYKLKKNPVVSEKQTFPKKLSETGLFRDVSRHKVAEGVNPYEIAIPLWRDGAEGDRYFALPRGIKRPIYFRGGDGYVVFGDGAVVMNTVSKAGKRRETQLIVKDKNEFFFYTYAWDDGEKDAYLVPSNGETKVFSDGLEWTYMSRSSCTTCHTAKTGFVNSFSFRQMSSLNQKAFLKWQENKLITSWGQEHETTPYPQWIGKLPDDRMKLGNLARGYLDVNCGSCHMEGGAAGRAQFKLKSKFKLADSGLLYKKPMLDISGNEGTHLITPAHPELSAILQRMSTRGAGKMPIIGSDTVDEDAVKLLEQWIKLLQK